MHIVEVINYIGCDEADRLTDLFGSRAYDVLERWLANIELEDMPDRVRANVKDIVVDVARELRRPVTRKEIAALEEIEVFEKDLLDELVEVEEPLRDEQGRVYELVPEDSRQMTLFDETGLPKPMARRYAK